MDWKNRLERTMGIHAAIAKAEQENFVYKKMIENLERKNATLHKCAYTAHNRITELLSSDEKTWDELCLFTELENLKASMEKILDAGTDEKVTEVLSESTTV